MAIALQFQYCHTDAWKPIASRGRKLGDYENVELKRFAIMFNINLIPGAISEILVSVADSGCITKADRYGLMAAVMDEFLPEDDRLAVNRLLHSLARGRIKIVDELSVVM